jgi:hypothetical protein
LQISRKSAGKSGVRQLKFYLNCFSVGTPTFVQPSLIHNDGRIKVSITKNLERG